MATERGRKRKSLGQINYESFVKESIKQDCESLDDYETWEELERPVRQRWMKGAAAVQSADRKRQRRDG